MTSLMAWMGSYDGLIVITGILCAVAAALPGNFLVLQRMCLLGDGFSHAVPTGLVSAFFLSVVAILVLVVGHVVPRHNDPIIVLHDAKRMLIDAVPGAQL